MTHFDSRDPRFPSALARSEPPVTALRVKGRVPDSFRAAVAIVGTRAADEEAVAFIERLAGELARAGCVIVSGGALGIDAAAHRGALEAGGVTVAVLASGFEPAYPKSNRRLFGDIVAGGGALFSEVPDGTHPHPGRFLARNRIVAALARVVVVGQAPIPSGALSTAACARGLKIPVMSVPSDPWQVRSRGSVMLLEGGALVCTSARSVLSVPALGAPGFSPGAPEQTENTTDFSGLEKDEARILKDLGSRVQHPDEIADRTGLSAREVQRALSLLLLKGLVEPCPGGRYGPRRAR